MIKDSREKELPTKQEVGTSDHTKHRTSMRLWSSLRNPRIVRVSRAFGGKDRHSKVSTIRGLRDRRVRLSVPTAMQLYDLQDKLGLNQPSKVVDWLLNAAQHEVDKLPPLPLIPGSFIQFPQTDARNDEQNLNSNNSRAQAFSSTEPMLISNISVDDFSSFSKSTLNSYTAFHQMEPNVSHVGNNSSQVVLSQDFHLGTSASSSSSLALMPATQLMMPSLFSSYLTYPNHFQTPSTFSQLLPWNSSNINLKQYIHQDEAAQQVESMRGSSTVYKDSGAGHESNAADFF